MLTFEPFPKIGRLRRNCTITEKIDGTNAQLQFDDYGNMLVGSRKRRIFPEGTIGRPRGCDNFGFAGWAFKYRRELFEFLGEGRHYGEWHGAGIQRGYGLEGKRFALFNVNRFGPGRQEVPRRLSDVGLTVVPLLYEGEFDSETIDDSMDWLGRNGSAINGHKAEGIIVYHHGTRTYSKVTFDHDEGKWSANE